MASDIFNRMTDSYGGGFAADSARITFAQAGVLGSGVTRQDGQSGGGVGMLVQTLQFNYQQQVTRIYEIGSNLSFLIMGRTQGSASLARVLGPRPIQIAFYSKYGDGCQAATNNLDIELNTGCDAEGEFGQAFAIKLKYCVITSIGMAISAQDALINEQLQLMFCSMSIRSLNN